MSSNHGDKVLVEVRPFAHQVGGHTCVLQLNQKTICKPFQHNEVWFYENEPEALKEFTPKYLEFIVLENLVHDYQRPCLMDLKMGRQQHGVDSSAEKRKLLEIRCASSTSATYGFRICGAQVYKANEGNYIFHDKYFGRALDDIGAVKELNQFFHNGILLRTDVIRAIMCKLEKLQAYLLTQDALRFDSCSLLIIYEGSPLNHQPETTVLMPDLGVEASQNTNSDVSICQENKSRTSQGCQQKSMTTNMTPKVDVRLIDFAHVSPQTTKDVTGNDIENSIVYGFEHLLNILKDSIK